MDKLREIDEITLLELLQLTSNDLVDAFADIIDEHEGRIRKALNDS